MLFGWKKKTPPPGPANTPAAPLSAAVQPSETVAPALDAAAPAISVAPAAAASPKKTGFFARLTRGLLKTRETIVKRIRKAIGLKARLDQDLLDEIEEILIQADVGVETTQKIISTARLELSGKEPPDAVLGQLKLAIRNILRKNERVFAIDTAHRPYVVLVVGVNGTGKTTTIAKIAQTLIAEGRKVMMVAGDTFRAAAIDQLGIWAERTGARFVASEMGADAAAVCFRSLQQAQSEGMDVVLIDTAGRLHTKKHLMDELEKVVRVIKKVIPDAPHETLLVLDATTGQNALSQAKIFTERCGVTGIVMTKLDGTAKGGVLIALRDQFAAPVLMIGIGETADDLRPFNADEFVEALFSEDESPAQS